MKRYIINFRKVGTREEMYDLIAKKLPLPDWCGRNLDALHDVFSQAGYKLEVRSLSALRENLGEYAEDFEAMLRATSAETELFEAIIKE